MLKIHIEGRNNLWDEVKEEFVEIPSCDIKLEHSLVSLTKWEEKYKKSFINTLDKTSEETIDYIRMMVLDEEFDERCLYLLTQKQLQEISDYIKDPMTATIISEDEEKEISEKNKRNKFTTAEEIYSWMVLQQIPFECQFWHLNKLIILIKLCALANKPKDDKKKKRMTSSDLALRRAKMEAARAKYSKH